jgi:glycosyltransferase involved in cell wall biosynthesis
MKILVVNKFLYNKGGSETYMFNLFGYMEKLGHQVDYFGMEDPDNIVGNSAAQYVPNIDFGGSILKKAIYPFRIIYSVQARKKIGKVIKNFRPDVIHLNNYNYQITPSILYEIKKYNLPVIQTLHDPQLVCPYHRLYNYREKRNCEKCRDGKFINCILHRCIDNSFAKSLMGAAESYIYRFLGTYSIVDTFICPSEFLKQKIISMNVNISRDKFIVLHNFTNLCIMEYNANTKPYVLYFGRISAEKGIRTLIKAGKELPEINFVFVGSGDIEHELDGIDNIEFVGFKSGEELKKIISEAKFSIYPSEWYENCPMSVLESQMYGTPVIGANIGGIPELIEDKFDGLLFRSGDADDLKDKIKYLYENEEVLKQYSIRCLEKVKKLSIEKYYSNLTHIYDAVIAKHSEMGTG